MAVGEAEASMEQPIGRVPSLPLEAPPLIEGKQNADILTPMADDMEDELQVDPEHLRAKAFDSFSRALSTGELEQALDVALENQNGADQTAQLQGEVKRLTAQVAALQLANETMQLENEVLRGGTDVGTVL